MHVRIGQEALSRFAYTKLARYRLIPFKIPTLGCILRSYLCLASID
jgi:hypothetical protein